MKNLLILLTLMFNISANAQRIPNTTTDFDDLTTDIIKWEQEKGDIILYKYSRYYEIVTLGDEPVEIKSPMYVKFFFNETRTQLLSVITAFTLDDGLHTIEYSIYVESRNISKDKIVDGNMIFKGEDQFGEEFTLALIAEKPSLSVYIGVNYSTGIYSTYVSAHDNVSIASFEEIIKNATQQDWDSRYNPD